MSTTPTMKFGKLTILNLDSSWATVSHDLDDSEVVAEREAALAEIDKQLAELNGALRAKRLIDAMTDEELAQAELKAQSRSHARTR